MIDKIKFYVEDIRLSDEILKSKFLRKHNSRNGNEVYLFDHFNSVFIKKNIEEFKENVIDILYSPVLYSILLILLIIILASL